MSSLTTSDLSKLWARNAQVPNTISTTVQELIARRASLRSNQPAIAAWDGDYTYGQFMHLASNLANHLSQHVYPRSGKVLPIVMSKSKWMPIAMVGALLGGWGIAPLDIATPTARLAQILDILDPPCILTTSEDTIAVSTAVPALAVDRFGLEDRSLSGPEQTTGKASAKVAAIVFTSGSTGSPKGVMLGPECISTSAAYGSQILQLGQGSRLFQFSSYSFDVSLHEIFMTLVAGGCLCIPSEAERLNNLVAAIQRMKANFICTTPSVMMSVLAEAVVSTPIEVAVLTGEALTSRISPLFDMGISLFSWYGATECPVVSLTPLVEENWASSQISSRHPGNCWVVQSEDSDVLCAFGEVGELLVESPMLTLGYLNAPQQTEAAFVVDPAWLTDGHGRVAGRRGRLYRTGDLVRNNRDWTLDYIGRKDTMVKIRGQRVDLSAVEFHIWNCLRSGDLGSPVRVKELVVEAIIPSQGSENASVSCFLYVERQLNLQPQCLPQKHLTKSTSLPCINLYAPDTLLQGLQAEIDRALRAVLPDYMVPSLYFQLSEMPFTPSGKVNRRLLRSLALQISSHDLLACRTFPQEDYILPHNGTELALQRLWAEVLGMDAATVHTNMSFLQCGGDSLRAILLSKALKTEFNLPTTVTQLLRRETTIQYLATLLEQHESGQTVDGPQMDIATILESWVASLGNVSINAPTSHSLGTRGSQVLLTGATGYLGTHILGELFNNHQVSKIVVIVRAADIGIAKERVREVAITAGWWQKSAFCRIEVWVGNLAEPQLGLQEEQWIEMSNIDTIIHNGAVVHYGADYDVLERANVISTFHLLEVALQSQRLRTFIFISGGIKQSPGQSEADYQQTLNGSEGYSQTKYVSEQLTLAAGRLCNEMVHTNNEELSRTFMVIKPGYIIGDEVSGLSNTDDFIWKLVAGAVRMGSFPSDPPDYWLDIAEVTYVARHITYQALLRAFNASPGPITPPRSINSGCSSPSHEDARENRTVNSTVIFDDLSRGLPVHRFWHAIQSQAQISLKQLDWDSWIGQANADLERDQEAHPLWSIQQHLGPSLGSRTPAKEVRLRSMEASGTLNEVEAAVRRCVEYLCNIQFIFLPFKEVSINPSYVNGMHPENNSSDSFTDDDEHHHLAKKRAVVQGKLHHPIINRSKLTDWS
ncbi:hypothetical protein M441DRAFT_61261 [Trichoderma asperellum CBS 433.97]|uniref:Carrier domain-containing protein n=1 Tax=Trichoderma asperellum (strain ATCC 204424 / CBS 433.97 / NBRC 101777) TaxID=1042311 RepID=A0A2T3YXH2_TRIA4|nr:hypothetical protein M441DRAFT_61261 [Trichoderma asperellum CBS 433.97]PTB37271.1 hypothetical protein M441DRAFT_61261 [Trichoderma asperellum CBS 433.97]